MENKGAFLRGENICFFPAIPVIPARFFAPGIARQSQAKKPGFSGFCYRSGPGAESCNPGCMDWPQFCERKIAASPLAPRGILRFAQSNPL
jgi:hypothetical protein